MMTFSDAIPVQFWLIDCDTYNEEERYGQYNRCFCAPWECDDEIKIQFQDTAGQNFSLLIYDDESSLLDSIPITETEEGVYLVSFTPTDNTPDFCEKKVQLQVRKEAGQQGIVLPEFNLWSAEDFSGIEWENVGTLNPSVSHTAPLTGTDLLWVDFSFIIGDEYTIWVTVNSIDEPGATVASLAIQVLDSSFSVQFSELTSGITGNATLLPLIFTATSSTTRIGIVGFLEGATITLESVTASRSVAVSEIIAKSDCLNVKAEHEGTILIQYSNYRNYAGIINNNGSPDLTFHLRIPAVFNEERFPETDEPLQLSNNRIISLNSQVKAQRLLETDQLPNYMRRKLMLVLKHQFITIEDKDYVKEEPLEEVENSNKHWPMRRMTCWLTEKEYVIRNIL